MSTATISAGPAGVRNLRAMFENKSNDLSTSPPSRGRSPNGSVSSQPSRQVSKVRTNFVAVDRPSESTQSPQRSFRKASDVSSMAELREEAMMEDTYSITSKSVIQDPPRSVGERTSLGAILKGSPFEMQSTVHTEQDQSSDHATVSPTATSYKSPAKANANGTKPITEVAHAPSTEHSATETASTTGAKPAKPTPGTLNTRNGTFKFKESPTLAKKSPLTQKKESPTVPNGNGPMFKPRGGVNKITGIIQSSNRAKEERAKAEQSKSADGSEDKTAPKETKPPPTASKPAAASKTHVSKQEKYEKPASNNDRVKSPTVTKSTKLPSAATAGTAASAARKGANTSDEEPKTATSERKSILPHAPRVANISTKASLAKKSSRASLANGEDRPRSRVSAAHKPADEGFLARMTRPTASSARRAQDKAPQSPPRARQTSANHEATKKPGRKSLNTDSKPAPTGDETDPSSLKPVNEDAAAVMNEPDEQDEGEPGPAEEEGEEIVV